MVYFTSDTHFGHKNIIGYCDRPFVNTFHMDEALIHNWNSVVKPEDTIYHLGDFSFYSKGFTEGKIIPRLNGNKILIQGNHDKKSFAGFEACYKSLVIDWGVHKIFLGHFPKTPQEVGLGENDLCLHGHTHANKTFQIGMYDVGVDNNNFYPVTLLQIADRIHDQVYEHDEVPQ